ncbi:LTA synthase family protein [Sulfurimonas sp. HSL3-7]|uniref:LTA synthase family protein n=1 Tax=Sulfonitrofixus jiaomeiensis TaxID=3131938 RepID=UPI0031F7D889
MYRSRTNFQAVMATIRELIVFYFLFIAIFFIGRSLLLMQYYDRIVDAGVNHWYGFLLGLQMDTIVVSIILVIPVLLLFTMPKVFEKPVRIFIRLYLLFFLLLAVYIENATFPFVAEFDVRPNDIFLNYLAYPKEVLGNIWVSYKPELFVAFVMMTAIGVYYWRRTRSSFEAAFEAAWWVRILFLVPLLAVLFIGIRSSFGHRAANISLASYTSSRLVNEVAKNSLFAIGYAYYSQKSHGSKMAGYGKMDMDEAYARVSKQLHIPVGDRKLPFFREQPSHFKNSKPKNLVIFVQESLGAQFVGELSEEKGITPNIDRLSRESIFFDEVYSNGTRSVRGIAGSTAGILAVPGKGVLKRNKSQNDFFTVASLLKPYGYHSSFIYGGESNFDNMRSWFLGNGFDEIIDQPEFKDPAFLGVWGVCDEDLVKRASREFVRHHANNEPFVSVLFSTTNHTPFEFPDGRIDLIEGEPANGVKNAIKFADYSIGELIRDAKKEGYYEDTVFMIISDHNVRTYGDDLVPVNMYHILGMILGGGVEPQRVTTLATQPDVLATALDAVGLDLTYPILGKSIFEDSDKDMVLMQFFDMYALRNGNEVAIVRPNKEALTFTYSDEHLLPAEHNQTLEKDAAAFVHVLNDIYQKRLFAVKKQ